MGALTEKGTIQREAAGLERVMEAARLAQSDPNIVNQIAEIEQLVDAEATMLRQTVSAAASFAAETATADHDGVAAAAGSPAIGAASGRVDTLAAVALAAFQRQSAIGEAMGQFDPIDGRLRSLATALDQPGAGSEAWQRVIAFSDQVREALDILYSPARLQASETISAREVAEQDEGGRLGSIPASAKRGQLDAAIQQSLASIRAEVQNLPEEQRRAALRSLHILDCVLVAPAMIASRRSELAVHDPDGSVSQRMP